jgi:pimeloyl-ACP methyl ester carboxylesterase
VDIVGHSDGADLALILARDHANLVRRLVISGANIRGIWSNLPAVELQRRTQWSKEQFAENLRSVAGSLPPWSQPDYAKVSPDGANHWMELMAKCYKMWTQPIVIEPRDLKTIAVPVLVMAGDHDFTSIEENAEIFRALPHAQLFIVPASNHGTFRARPNLVNLAIREFLEQPENTSKANIGRPLQQVNSTIHSSISFAWPVAGLRPFRGYMLKTRTH